MATILRNPFVEDYFEELTLDQIAARPHGIADLFEAGKLIIIKDYRLDFDFDAMAMLDERTDAIADSKIVRKLKKTGSTIFFEGEPPVETPVAGGGTRWIFPNRIRQAMFDSLCRGDIDLYRRASSALKGAHEELQRIFSIAFPHYRADRLLPSVRLTETLFEGLHWDIQSIDEDYHQARVFCNLDKGKRVWNVSHNFLTFIETVYDEQNLARFRDRDPDKLVSFICSEYLGGTTELWRDTQPKHKIAFDPGEVWLGESRLISHAIDYGQRAAVYMWIVDYHSMHDSNQRFRARIDALHAEKAARPAAAIAA